MTDDELNPPPTDDDAPAAAAEVSADAAEAPAAVDPDDGPDSGPLADAPPAPADNRPKETIRGIHPELLCTCPECDPEFVELQWFSPEEQKKVKGDVMLFCARSSRKYFTPIINLNEWIAEKGGPRKRGRNAD